MFSAHTAPAGIGKLSTEQNISKSIGVFTGFQSMLFHTFHSNIPSHWYVLLWCGLSHGIQTYPSNIPPRIRSREILRKLKTRFSGISKLANYSKERWNMPIRLLWTFKCPLLIMLDFVKTFRLKMLLLASWKTLIWLDQGKFCGLVKNHIAIDLRYSQSIWFS